MSNLFWRMAVRRRLRALALLLISVSAVALFVRSEPLYSLEREQRQRALLATVQVVVPDNRGAPYSAGSGTVLDAERGLILTNFHVIGERPTGSYFNDEGMAIIGVNPANLRGTPIFKYFATIVRADAEMDLALLQVVAPFEDRGAALPTNLGLTNVERGASIDLEIGDPVYVLGFPGLGGDTVTYTEGIVSGFLDEDRDGVEEWIKTDAEVNHGNSGGLAVNDTGEFIGVPSAGYTDSEAAGKISLIRPSDLALTYYDAWTVASGAPVESNAPQVVAIVYGDTIGNGGKVEAPLARFPAGTPTIYVSFDYRNIPRGQSLTWQWLANGVEIDSGAVNRGRRESGSEWLSLNNPRGLASGLYELELRVGATVLYRGGVIVGVEAAADNVQIGELIFAEGVADDGAAIAPAATFANVGEVFAIFAAQGLTDGVMLRTVWYYEGEAVLDDEEPWHSGDVETGWITIRHPDGLPIGTYRLEVYVEGSLAQAGEFAVVERSALVVQRDVAVQGEVHDADNHRRKVNGALVVLLKPGVTVNEWMAATYDENMIHASGSSNRSGIFQLDGRVEPGVAYAVVVLQEDHLPVLQDAFQIPADTPDPFFLDVAMERR